MTEFRVGDRVTAGASFGGEWVDMTIVKDDGPLVYSRYDAQRDSDGEIGAFAAEHLKLIAPNPLTAELTEFRLFKAEALRAGYVPKVAVDPDLAEANKLAEECGWATWDIATDGNPMWEASGVYLTLRAIKRGRELAAQEAGNA